MQLTPDQVKGRIKNIAKQNDADSRTLMRIYMIERFLERLAVSQYRDNFIIKGGILVTAMVGVAHRSTMDVDASMKNLNLSAEDALRVVTEIKDIDIGDNVIFEVKEVSNIMDEMEYPGIRITMNAVMGKLVTPLKIDISTGDTITPREVELNYGLLLEERAISLWSYNLETVLAEKLQTVLARGLLNTRMRDFYDIWMLLSVYEKSLDSDTLQRAFDATCKKRDTEHLQEKSEEILSNVEADSQMQILWKSYQKKFTYATNVTYEDIICSTRKLLTIINSNFTHQQVSHGEL
jgi:predicted nucleotidyltransferase component of viral defense system